MSDIKKRKRWVWSEEAKRRNRIRLRIRKIERNYPLFVKEFVAIENNTLKEEGIVYEAH
jgi:hypothetical protein